MVDARDVPVSAWPHPDWSGEYAELGAMTNFSFLEGASHPGELMMQAKALGLSAVGVADRNTMAGMVRALIGAEDNDVHLVVGCRLAFVDGTELIVFPRDRAAYGRLCRLLTMGKSEAVPVEVSPPLPPNTTSSSSDLIGGFVVIQALFQALCQASNSRGVT